jgi:aryl carrier-like protein
MQVAMLDPTEALARYGLDSISGAQITSDLKAQFGELSATLLFENSTVAELAEFMVLTYRDLLPTVLAPEEEIPPEFRLIESPTSTALQREAITDSSMRDRNDAAAAPATGVFDARLYRDVLERLAQGRLDVEDALTLTE